MSKLFETSNNLRKILYFFAFVAGWPCVFYLMGWLPDYKVNYLVYLGVLIIVCFFSGAAKPPNLIFSLLIIQCFTWVCFYFIHDDAAYFTRILYLLIVLLLLAIIRRNKETDSLIKLFNGWVMIQAILGSVGVLMVLTNVLQPLFTFTELDGRTGYFFGFFATNTYLGGLVRNAGFFDEPGALAYWGMIALLLNKVFIGDRKMELLLIIGLVSTFSIAYFIQLGMYLVLFNRKGGSGKRYVIVVLCVVLALVYFFANFNEDLFNAILGRLTFDESTGRFEGDNRSDLAIVTLAFFLQAPIFGHGSSALLQLSQQADEFVGANPFSLLAADGIIGYGSSLLPFFFILLKNKHKNKSIIYAWIIIFVGLLQRPYDGTQLLYPLTIYLFLQAEIVFNTDNRYPNVLKIYNKISFAKSHSI